MAENLDKTKVSRRAEAEAAFKRIDDEEQLKKRIRQTAERLINGAPEFKHKNTRRKSTRNG